jgi:hypothetical protein
MNELINSCDWLFRNMCFDIPAFCGFITCSLMKNNRPASD